MKGANLALLVVLAMFASSCEAFMEPSEVSRPAFLSGVLQVTPRYQESKVGETACVRASGGGGVYKFKLSVGNAENYTAYRAMACYTAFVAEWIAIDVSTSSSYHASASISFK